MVGSNATFPCCLAHRIVNCVVIRVGEFLARIVTIEMVVTLVIRILSDPKLARRTEKLTVTVVVRPPSGRVML